MTEWLLPTLVLLVALSTTYLCCVRRLRSGGCHPGPAGTPAADDRLPGQVRRARAERDRAPGGPPAGTSSTTAASTVGETPPRPAGSWS